MNRSIDRNEKLAILIISVFAFSFAFYFAVIDINNGVKLHQAIGRKAVEYEDITKHYYEEPFNTLTKEEFAKYKAVIENDKMVRIKQYVVFEYQNNLIRVAVTPGRTSMKILDIEVEEKE